MSDYLKKTITIKEASEDETKFYITDQDKIKYSGFKQWERANTQGYNDYKLGNHNEPFTVGDHAQLTYKETSKPNKYGTMTTYRNITGMLPSSPPAVSQSETEKSSNLGHSGASQVHSSDAFGRRLGVQGHINALLSNPTICDWNIDGPIVAKEFVPKVIRLAIQIEDEAEKQLNPSPLREAVTRHAPSVVDELPVIQVDEDLDSIPF